MKNNEWQQNLPDTSLFKFTSNLNEHQFVKAAFSLACIIQQTGTFSEQLLYWLKNNSFIINSPYLSWHVEDMLGRTYHTNGDIPKAIYHTKSTILLREKESLPIANNVIWCGYEYLCMGKRPSLKKPLRLLVMPYYVWKGIRLLKKGIILDKKESKLQKNPDSMSVYYQNDSLAAPVGYHTHIPLKTIAEYYYVDFLHSWGNIIMLLGKKSVPFCRLYFRRIEKKYRDISISSHLMNSSYYWLRHLEAKMLAGIPISHNERNEIMLKLDELEINYELVQNYVQIGNTCSYRGLMYYLLDKNITEAEKEISKAEEKWLKAGGVISSGQRRVILFKRFIGKMSFPKAIKAFITQ
jgi:hypothetical protein